MFRTSSNRSNVQDTKYKFSYNIFIENTWLSLLPEKNIMSHENKIENTNQINSKIHTEFEQIKINMLFRNSRMNTFKFKNYGVISFVWRKRIYWYWIRSILFS